MKEVTNPLNPILDTMLEEFSNWFFTQDLSLVKLDGKPDENEYHTSKEYLDSIDKKNHIGYPEVTHGVDIMRAGTTPIEWREQIVGINTKLNHFLGSKFCAVNMYYPPGGYMGWHNNHNCPGWNILLSYTPSGRGFFRYLDPITQDIVTMPDKPGWFAKVGYYGHLGEPDKVYWHCARAYGPRLTFGYVIPDESLWEMMVADIQDQ